MAKNSVSKTAEKLYVDAENNVDWAISDAEMQRSECSSVDKEKFWDEVITILEQYYGD